MKIKPNEYNRRDLFKMLGGSALFLHPLLSSREGFAAAAGIKRFVVMHTPNGFIQDAFWPTGNTGNYKFDGRTLEPLKANMGDINVIKGLRVGRGPNDAHVGGMVALLTGNVVNPKIKEQFKGTFYGGEYLALGPSIDQMIAGVIREKTSKASLHLSVMPKSDRWSKFFTFDSKGKMIQREGDPYSVYQSIIADITTCAGSSAFPSTQEMLAKRKSIIDSIVGDLTSATAHTGLTASEKIKLDEYLTSIRDIEKNLKTAVPTEQEVCDNLVEFGKEKIVITDSYNYPKIANMMQDLIIVAFQLDVTRVASLSYAVSGIPQYASKHLKYNGKPLKTHHELSHGNQSTTWKEDLKVLDKYHAACFSRLVTKMKAVDENGTKLLDNSLALWSSEIADGFNHNSYNTPFILAGKAGGKVKTGRFIQAPGNEGNPTEHHGLLLDILDAYGVKHNNKIGLATNPKRIL